MAPVPLNVTDDPAQTVDEGEMVAPTFGYELSVTARAEAALLPHELDGVTEMFPEVDPKVTETDVLFWPELMVAPGGTTQA